jgi:hypothetical protein
MVREHATQQKKKVSILKLRARETAKKVKMCPNSGRDRPGPGFTRKISKFFGLNRTAREQATQWKKKVWTLNLRARGMAAKVKTC